MFKFQKGPNGFTLIELLVVVAIIAILSVIGFTSYSQAQISARDGKRKQDVKSLQEALELYHNVHNHYPDYHSAFGDSYGTTGCGGSSTNWQTQLFSYVDPSRPEPGGDDYHKYISVVPIDPINNCVYHYNYDTLFFTDGVDGYKICAQLENRSDPEAHNTLTPTATQPRDAWCWDHNYGVWYPYPRTHS